MSLLHALWAGGWLRAVDHALALSLRRAREETPDWVQAAAALASRALAHGHGRLPLARLPELFSEIDAEREPPELPALPEWLALLRASPWVHDVQDARVPRRAGSPEAAAEAGSAPSDRVLVLDGEAIALRRYSEYENRLAQALRARLAAGPGALQLVTGGPGTGKTTRVAQLLQDFIRAWPEPSRPPPARRPASARAHAPG